MDHIRSLAEEATEIGFDAKALFTKVGVMTQRLNESRELIPAREMTEAEVYAFIESLDPANADVETLAEAIKLVKKIWKTAGVKAREKADRRPKLARMRAYGRIFRKRAKARIKKKQGRLLRRFGGWSGLKSARAKAGKTRKRIRIDYKAPQKEAIEALRAQMAEADSVAEETEKFSPFEEAAIQAGILALHLAEVFDVLGHNEEMAAKLREASDEAADLSETFEFVMTEEDLPEVNEAELLSILSTVWEGVEAYEAIGAPTLFEAMAMAEGDDEGDEDDDDDDKKSKGKKPNPFEKKDKKSKDDDEDEDDDD